MLTQSSRFRAYLLRLTMLRTANATKAGSLGSSCSHQRLLKNLLARVHPMMVLMLSLASCVLLLPLVAAAPASEQRKTFVHVDSKERNHQH
jgi:hypothetical protein